LLSGAVSFEVEAVGVVDETIEDRVGDGGIPIISYQRSTGNSPVTCPVLDNKAAPDSIVAQIAFWSEFFSKLLDRTSPQHFCYVMLERCEDLRGLDLATFFSPTACSCGPGLRRGDARLSHRFMTGECVHSIHKAALRIIRIETEIRTPASSQKSTYSLHRFLHSECSTTVAIRVIVATPNIPLLTFRGVKDAILALLWPHLQKNIDVIQLKNVEILWRELNFAAVINERADAVRTFHRLLQMGL
jgi:hypothetical protein